MLSKALKLIQTLIILEICFDCMITVKVSTPLDVHTTNANLSLCKKKKKESKKEIAFAVLY